MTKQTTSLQESERHHGKGRSSIPRRTQRGYYRLTNRQIGHEAFPQRKEKSTSGSSYEEEEREENSMMFEYVLRNQQLLLEDLLKLEVGEEARTRIEAQLELIEKTLNS